MKQLHPGDQAPSFAAKNQREQTVKLSDYSGQKVFVYFYPKDTVPELMKALG